MKKIILSTFILISISLSSILGQSENLLASNDIGSEYLSYDSKEVYRTTANASPKNAIKHYEMPKKSVDLKLGSNRNWINISVNNTVKYTKAELLNSTSNETVHTLQLNSSQSSVNIAEVASGTYFLILSNNAGDIFSEKLIIL